MTTIAFDGRYLAADGHTMLNSATVALDSIKLAVGAAHIYGVFGSSNHFPAWVEWAELGAEPRDHAGTFPVSHDVANADSVLVRVDVETRLVGCCTICTPYFRETAGPAAFGSGSAFALAAMDCDRMAMDAVCMAARRDPMTKGVVRYIDLQDLAKGVQVWQDLAEASPPNVARRYLPVGVADREKVNEWFTKDMKVKGYLKEPTHVGREPIVHDLKADLMVTSGAMQPLMLVIKKPSKIRWPDAPDIERGWRPDECVGRLIDATGCGHCLRCNREWFALCKQYGFGGSRPEIVMTQQAVEETHAEWNTWWADPPTMFDKLLNHLKIEQIDRDPSTAASYHREGDGIAHEYVELRAEANNMIGCRFALADELKAYLKTVPTADRLVWRNRPEIVSEKRFAEDDTIWKGFARCVALPADEPFHADPHHMPASEKARSALLTWVTEWNAASAAGDHARKAELDIALRTMTFPEGCRLISHPASIIDSHDWPWKQIVWEDGTKTPEG